MTVAHPEAGVAPVDDHPFRPRDYWWSLCAICHLAESAHTSTAITASYPVSVAWADRNGGRP